MQMYLVESIENKDKLATNFCKIIKNIYFSLEK